MNKYLATLDDEIDYHERIAELSTYEQTRSFAAKNAADWRALREAVVRWIAG